MALTQTQTAPQTSLLSALAAPFQALGRGLIFLAEQNTQYRRSMQLHSMTDAQLAEKGIKREDIFRTVYSSSLYI